MADAAGLQPEVCQRAGDLSRFEIRKHHIK
jgi:hypothetical protein